MTATLGSITLSTSPSGEMLELELGETVDAAKLWLGGLLGKVSGAVSSPDASISAALSRAVGSSTASSIATDSGTMSSSRIGESRRRRKQDNQPLNPARPSSLSDPTLVATISPTSTVTPSQLETLDTDSDPTLTSSQDDMAGSLVSRGSGNSKEKLGRRRSTFESWATTSSDGLYKRWNGFTESDTYADLSWNQCCSLAVHTSSYDASLIQETVD